MTLWIAMAALTALVLGLLLRVLLRAEAPATATARPELAVYRDQLGEIERDLAAGRLPPTEAAVARREIERRMLALADAPAAARRSGPPSRGTALALLLLLPGAALGLYLWLGQPELPGQPLAARTAELGERSALEQEAGRLSAALRADQGNADLWRRLGFVLVQLGETESAVQAFQTALTLGQPLGPAWESETWSLLADAIIQKHGGQVPPMARQSLARALELDPENLLALFLSGLAMRQDGALEAAWELWLYVAEAGGGDLPWQARLALALEALGADLKRAPPPL